MALVQNNTTEKAGFLDFQVPAPAKTDNKSDFGQVMQSTSTKDANVSEQPTVQRQPEQKDTSAPEKQDAKLTVKEKLSAVCSKAQEKLSMTETDPEEVAEIVGALITDIKELLLNTFQISEEDLSALMMDLGLTDMDLLNPALMDQLAVKLTGAESSMDLLFQPELMDTLKTLQQEIAGMKENVFSELKLTEKEVEEILKEMPDDVEVEEALPKLQEENTGTQKEEIAPRAERAPEIRVEAAKPESVESTQPESQETDSGKGESTLKQGFQQMENPVLTQITNAVEEALPETEAQSVVTQLVERIRVVMNEDTTSFEMQLNPEHLGKINLQVAAKNGVVTAQIATENESVKEILESQIVVLRESLNNQGIKVEAVEVTVASHEFERNLDSQRDPEQNQQESGQKRRFRFDVMQAAEEELTPGDAVIRDMMLANGNQINTTA